VRTLRSQAQAKLLRLAARAGKARAQMAMEQPDRDDCPTLREAVAMAETAVKGVQVQARVAAQPKAQLRPVLAPPRKRSAWAPAE
jgi:hypothetical protein